MVELQTAGAPPALSRLAEAIAPSLNVDGVRCDRGGCVAARRSARGRYRRHRLRLWTNPRCLVTARRFAAMPGFCKAAAASARAGWPVYVRPSGGTTVAHRPGTLNASHLEAWLSEGDDAIRRFRLFCEHLATSVRSLGVPPYLSRVADSHCDGSFNLASGVARTPPVLRDKDALHASTAPLAGRLAGDRSRPADSGDGKRSCADLPMREKGRREGPATAPPARRRARWGERDTYLSCLLSRGAPTPLELGEAQPGHSGAIDGRSP